MGVLADPGLPVTIAERLAGELPELLARRASGRVSWKVEVVSQALILDEQGDIPMIDLAREWKPRKRWDFMVCLTDLPRRAGAWPILSEISLANGVALTSLPAIKGFRLRRQVRDTIVHLVDMMARHGLEPDRREHRPRPRLLQRPTELVSPVRHVPSTKSDADVDMVLLGARGRARLLFGMVRDNRPWRLVPHLASATAAAAAVSAFGVFYSTIWSMADALSPTRLAAINAFAIATMVGWLIVYNSMWERPSEPTARKQAVIYNASTVLTLTLGVWCMYIVLFAITLAGALAVISADLLQGELGHPVGVDDYAALVWLASSMGTVAGALGSNLDGEEAVLEATYSRRELERRARRRAQEQNSTPQGDTVTGEDER